MISLLSPPINGSFNVHIYYIKKEQEKLFFAIPLKRQEASRKTIPLLSLFGPEQLPLTESAHRDAEVTQIREPKLPHGVPDQDQHSLVARKSRLYHLFEKSLLLPSFKL